MLIRQGREWNGGEGMVTPGCAVLDRRAFTFGAAPNGRFTSEGRRVPTLIFNGYGGWIAGLHASRPRERLFM
jgi:hypothetical protein